MEKIFYPAKIIYQKKDKRYLVEFPNLEGCLTEGETLEEACQNAKEALSGYLSSIFERGFTIPEPSILNKKNFYQIEPDPDVAIPIMLRKIREEQKISQIVAASRLDISYQAYQRLENPNKFNATIMTLDKVAKIFGKRLHVEIA
jgi:antitoxin HicB